MDESGRVNWIPATPVQCFDRQQLMRKRMFSQSRIFLNNSNSKWLDIGVKPSSPKDSEGIKNFTTEVFLDGEKCSRLALGGALGFRQLIRQIRGIQEFQLFQENTYVSISHIIYII